MVRKDFKTDNRYGKKSNEENLCSRRGPQVWSNAPLMSNEIALQKYRYSLTAQSG